MPEAPHVLLTRLATDLGGESVEIDLRAHAEGGTRLLDLADEHPELDLPFSCRAATCGTCRVEVMEGSDAFAEPEPEERDLLEAFGEPAGVRLACQALVVRAVPTIRLRVVDPW